MHLNDNDFYIHIKLYEIQIHSGFMVQIKNLTHFDNSLIHLMLYSRALQV